MCRVLHGMAVPLSLSTATGDRSVAAPARRWSKAFGRSVRTSLDTATLGDRLKPLLQLGVAPFLLSLCSAATLELEIEHTWNGAPISLSDSWHPRSSGDEVSFARLAYLLSEPTVVTTTGDRIDVPDSYGFLSLKEKSTIVRLGNLQNTRSVLLEFSVGLPEDIDRADPNQWPPGHALNPVRNNLHWSWQGGYIFLAVEGRWRSTEAPESGFSYHLGNAPHRMRVQIPLDADLTASHRVRLRFHLDRVLGDSKQVVISEQTSTHGRDGDALAMTLKTNVESAFELVSVDPVDPVDPAPLQAPAQFDTVSQVGTPYPFRMKADFPLPALPTDYPLTKERVELGRRLFNDASLSRDSSISCASCHDASAAFSDARTFSVGIDGQIGTRHAMPLMNLAWKNTFFWDGRAPSLRDQILMPIQDPTEMHETLENVEAKLARHPAYPSLFKAAFGTRETTAERLAVAIEQFLLTQTSFDSRFDRARYDKAELSEQEKRGFELFFTEYDPRREQFGADCFHCHGGAFFTDHGFHNNGLDFKSDLGVGAVTGKESDHGKFATPSLRNVALTAPYMHDGRFETLEEVVEHYATGIHRSPTLDPNLAKHFGNGIPLSESDKAALVAFLKTLSDPKFEKPSSLE